MKKVFPIFLVSIFLIGVGCGPKGPSKPISEGERLFRNRCANCHRLPDKKRNDWPRIMQKHAKRANLNETQVKMLLDFLATD